MLRTLFVALAVSAAFAGVPSPEETKRLMDHFSDAEHFKNEHHNKQFDHDAFLGEDQAKTFDQLPPEESKRRLGIIVDKIDTDKDGFVSLVELKDWIRYTQKRYIEEDVDRHWRQHNPDNNDEIPWESYRKNVYGFMDDMEERELSEPNSEGFTYANLQKRDRRRWVHADLDNNDALNRTEFASFLHPEDHPTMRDIVVLETLEDIDKDKIKQFLKTCSVPNYTKKMRQLLDKMEENSKFVERERSKVSFALSDTKMINAWETSIRNKGTPLLNFFESWNKINKIQKRKKVTKNDELATELPMIKRPKISEEATPNGKSEHKGPLILFPSDDEDEDEKGHFKISDEEDSPPKIKTKKVKRKEKKTKKPKATSVDDSVDDKGDVVQEFSDGKVSLEEYIGDMYTAEDGEEGEEPDWVKQEREQFQGYRDTNKDGFMDEHEVKEWIAPPEFDHAEAEARHLVFEADGDADEKLTKEEILEKYDLFVGSQATDFGEALARHDEF